MLISLGVQMMLFVLKIRRIIYLQIEALSCNFLSVRKIICDY